jgi:O-antigen ligase
MKSAEIAVGPHAGGESDAQPLAFAIARVLLVATLIGATLAFGAVDTWAWVGVGLVACLAIVLWAAGSVQEGALKLVWSPLFIPLALFLILGLVQYGARVTLDRSEAREALVLLSIDITLFFLTVQLYGRAGSAAWRRFGLAVLVFAGSLGLFAILQFASGQGGIYGKFGGSDESVFGPYGNLDHYAGLMEMLVPVAVLYIFGRKHRLSLAAWGLLVFAAVVAVASLLLSGSRGGLIALSVETVIVIALCGWGVRGIEGRRLPMAVGAAILAAALLFSWVDPGRVSERLGVVLKVGSPTWVDWIASRKSYAMDSLRMVRDHPVLGVGLGSFETAYPGYQSLPGDEWVDHAHDDYVEAIAETGVVGGMLILSAVALFLRLAFADLGYRLRSGIGWIQLGSAIGCCGLLVHSFFDYNLHIPANAAWFAVLAGLSSAENPTSQSKHSPSPHSEATTVAGEQGLTPVIASEGQRSGQERSRLSVSSLNPRDR